MLSDQRDIIKRNFKCLVRETDLDTLLPELLRRNVFTVLSAAKFQGQDKMLCKRRLFLDIQDQGSNSFQQLLESLNETGHEHLAELIRSLPVRKKQSPVRAFRMTSIDELERNLERSFSRSVHIVTNTKAVDVRVIPSDRFYDDIDSPVYKTRSRHRGIAFIVNNIKFDRDEERNGAHMDGENLKKLFQQCGFEIIYLENLKADEIKSSVLKHAKNKELSKYDIAFFIFMSHGKEGIGQSNLKATDEKFIQETWIESQFSNKNCEALRNKPKIFIFQMCRGDLLDGRTQTDGVPSFSLPLEYSTVSDILIGHATLPGYKAHRDIYEGSWYIDCLCKTFMNHAHNEDIETLLKRVDGKLRGMKSSDMTSQTSTYHNVRFKTCYLHPGIYEENGELKRFNENTF